MPISLRHRFVCTKPDAPDNTIVRPSDWNEEHDIEMSSGFVLGRTTTGDGEVEELSPITARNLLQLGTAALNNLGTDNDQVPTILIADQRYAPFNHTHAIDQFVSTVVALGDVTGIAEINRAVADIFTMTLTGDITVSITGTPIGVRRLKLMITDPGGFVITWPAGVAFDDRDASVVLPASGLAVYDLETIDGGTFWLARLSFVLTA